MHQITRSASRFSLALASRISLAGWLPAAGDAMMASMRSRWAFLVRSLGGRRQPAVRSAWRRAAAVVFAACLFGSFAEKSCGQPIPIPDPEPPAQGIVAPAPVSPPTAYQAVPAPTPPAVAPTTKPPTSPVVSAAPASGQYALHMHDGTCLMGVFGETKAVPFEAVFGKIEIPMASIRTVEFAVMINGAKTHRVQFINGDSLTGNVGRIAPVKFQTSYGMLTVPMEHVVRLTAPASQPVSAPKPLAIAQTTPASTQNGVQLGIAVPVADAAPPGPIRPATGVIVPDDEVR
jgi:hypothetical protein